MAPCRYGVAVPLLAARRGIPCEGDRLEFAVLTGLNMSLDLELPSLCPTTCVVL